MPAWSRTISVSDAFHNNDLSFEEKRDAIVARIRQSGWLEDRPEWDNLAEHVQALSEAESKEDFNIVWDVIYDYADEERVWISTF